MSATSPSAGYYPDREQRPGGRWSAPRLLGDVLRLVAIERAVAHVLAGWIPKVADLDEKVRLGADLEATMARAADLRRDALVLCERDEAGLVVSRAWVEPLRVLDASPTADAPVEALTREIPAFVLSRYLEIAAAADPLYDARLLRTVRAAIAELSPAAPPAPADGSLARCLQAALSEAETLTVPLDLLLWGPADRVPSPARPAGRPRPETGSRAHLRSRSRLDPEDLAGELNDNVMSELCAMELMCRCSYEHPDLPWSFHLDVARHVGDEARHASIFRRLLAERGFSEDGMPQHASNYEYSYRFPECEEGSERELVWRLLILCTVLEGLAIDKLPLEIATRDTLGQYDIARALDYVSLDELFHVENGLRWTRRLCTGLQLDPMIERERVHGRFFGRQYELRAQYLDADSERAKREIEILEGPDPDGMTFESRTEVELRRRASFTDEECRQVDRWGYNPRSTPVDAPA